MNPMPPNIHWPPNVQQTGNNAALRLHFDNSERFKVTIGVEQGCVLAPVVLNVLLLAVTLLSVQRSVF